MLAELFLLRQKIVDHRFFWILVVSSALPVSLIAGKTMSDSNQLIWSYFAAAGSCRVGSADYLPVGTPILPCRQSPARNRRSANHVSAATCAPEARCSSHRL